MAKYKQVPYEFEAVKWSEDINIIKDVPWIDEAVKNGKAKVKWSEDSTKPLVILFMFREVVIPAYPGDYIILEKGGSICPCQAEHFEKTFELVQGEQEIGL